jgi:hypothetical protein
VIGFPAACDALVAAFAQATGGDVFDGPPARLPGSSGVAVGTAREDAASEWTASAAGLDGRADEDVIVTCLAWSGGGGVVFKPHRDTVRGLLELAEQGLAADRSLGGAVDTAYLTGGSWTQEQTGEGALVTCEFRVNLHRF